MVALTFGTIVIRTPATEWFQNPTSPEIILQLTFHVSVKMGKEKGKKERQYSFLNGLHSLSSNMETAVHDIEGPEVLWGP
jgi:hypothetical protein